MKQCICPTIIIQCLDGQLSKQDIRAIANIANAQVEVKYPDSLASSTIWGPHRKDCPCHPDYKV